MADAVRGALRDAIRHQRYLQRCRESYGELAQAKEHRERADRWEAALAAVVVEGYDPRLDAVAGALSGGLCAMSAEGKHAALDRAARKLAAIRGRDMHDLGPAQPPVQESEA